MNGLGVFSIQIFNQDNMIDYVDGIIAWTRYEAYALVMYDLKRHNSYSVHRVRDANEEEIKEYMQKH